jgi:hypothetical protein
MNKDDFGATVPLAALGNTQKITLGVSEQHISLNTYACYRLWPTVNCFIRQGQTGTAATTDDCPLTANVDYHIHTGINWNTISAIVATGSGILYVTELIYRLQEC